MNYVTTNIRLPEADYLRLKQEAAIKRTSLSAVIRKKIGAQESRSTEDTQKLIADLNKTSQKMGKRLKGFDIVKAVREMREE